jgi:hypothetical protein
VKPVKDEANGPVSGTIAVLPGKPDEKQEE